MIDDGLVHVRIWGGPFQEEVSSDSIRSFDFRALSVPACVELDVRFPRRSAQVLGFRVQVIQGDFGFPDDVTDVRVRDASPARRVARLLDLSDVQLTIF